jgi:peptidoglycan/LPS O-acetylase OafA/YrhL
MLNKPQVNSPERLQRSGDIVSLTTLRGLLAVWVVMYHFWNDVLRLFPLAEILSPIVRVGQMAVPAFFMLSGFVLAYNYADRFASLSLSAVARFLCLRLARIYPVHLVSLLAVAVMVWMSGRLSYQLTDGGYTSRNFVLNLLLVQTWVPDFNLNWNYPSWSISSEWFAYLAFPLAISWGARWLKTLFRSIMFGFLSLSTSIAVMLLWRPLPFYELVLVIPTFFVGTAVYSIVRNWYPSSCVAKWIPELLILCAVAVCFVPSTVVVTTSLLCLFFGLILVLALNREAILKVWMAWPMVFLGEVSYSLYMTHTLAQRVLTRVLPSSQFENAPIPVKVLIILAYLGLVIMFCLAMYFTVEYPCRVWFKKILFRKKRLIKSF